MGLRVACYAPVTIIIFVLIPFRRFRQWIVPPPSAKGKRNFKTRLKQLTCASGCQELLATGSGRSPRTDARRNVGAYDQNKGAQEFAARLFPVPLNA